MLVNICLRCFVALVTITHNNRCGEMLATLRRGPLAASTEEERLEFLLTRKKKSVNLRKGLEVHAMEHVLSFQRRVAAIKLHFLPRGKPTPLGIPLDYWDRTEAQQRGALHSHTLVWCKKRAPAKAWVRLEAIPRSAPGSESRQRLPTQKVQKLAEFQWDTVYQRHELGEVSAEMVRADVSGANWGGHTWETLRVCGLGRSILRSAYLHTCTPSYCLKDRSCCRFAFPWPEQPYQVYDGNTQRVALMRRHPEDDQWVVPHNLLLMMYSPASVNVICFDSERNCYQARCYAGKYCSKPEKW